MTHWIRICSEEVALTMSCLHLARLLAFDNALVVGNILDVAALRYARIDQALPIIERHVQGLQIHDASCASSGIDNEYLVQTAADHERMNISDRLRRPFAIRHHAQLPPIILQAHSQFIDTPLGKRGYQSSAPEGMSVSAIAAQLEVGATTPVQYTMLSDHHGHKRTPQGAGLASHADT